MKKANLLRVVNEVTLNNGVTYNLNTNEINPDYGYMVAVPGHEVKSSYFDKALLKTYVLANAKVLCRDGHYLGVWQEPDGMYCIDVSRLLENREQAILAGKQARQQAIWDNAKRDEIWIS